MRESGAWDRCVGSLRVARLLPVRRRSACRASALPRGAEPGRGAGSVCDGMHVGRARPSVLPPGVGSSVGCVLFSMPKHGGRGGLPRRWMCGLVRIRVRAASEARNFLGGSRPGSAGLRRRPAGRAAAVARCPSEFAPGCCRPRAWHRGGSAQGSIQVKGLIGETGRRRGTLRANTESDVQTAWGVPGIQITDRLVQTCWADRGFPASCAKKGRRPDGGRYKSSLADGSLPGYPSICSGNPFVKRTRSTSGLRLFIPVLRKVLEWIHFSLGRRCGAKTRGGGGGALGGGLSDYLVDPASSHMLVSKIKPCMCKYKLFCTVKLRMAH